METPFLQLVAEAYARHHGTDVDQFCFVFPNKRSAAFFSQHLDKALSKSHISPCLMTISELVSEFSEGIDATRYEQLFMLYNEYAKLSKEISSFDRFMFWGDMLISDFNDVDRYMVDADQLFINVERLKEISSNYLTEEQLEVIRRYWGDEKPHEYREQFWNHISHGEEEQTTANKKFLKLWEVLAPLYKNFRQRLREHGLTTSGMRYREAAENMRHATLEDFEYKRYIFCGFNVLSTSEIKIFSRLKALGLGDFYWDYNSPTFKLPRNRAGRFIEHNIKEFPSIYQLEAKEITDFPEINIIGVPSNIGQAKMTGSIISGMMASGAIKNRANAINTAIVLADETLFLPLIHSIPLGDNGIETLNITMGFPMRLLPVASLIHNIVMLQLKVRNIHGEPAFFHEDVRMLLGMSTIYNMAPKECNAILEQVTERRMFMLPVSLLQELAPAYSVIFTPVGPNSGVEQVYQYTLSVLNMVEEEISRQEEGAQLTLQIKFIQAYKLAVEELYDAAREHKIKMQDLTFFQLMERIINSAKLNFVGEPLKGLQVMGMLETRSLDFENVVVLSMNERIFPRKQFTRSFIPETLRRAYGMATTDFQESIYAYYFYRLIARAKRVWLTYDARNVGGTKSSEMSRYLTQLLYLFSGANAKHTISTFKGTKFNPTELTVQKSERVMELLAKFTTTGSGFNLSPSALHTYIECPLHFYLQYVEGYRSESEVTDYMDSATYGTIYHEVAQKFYETMAENGHQVITTDLLEHYIDPKNQLLIDQLFTSTINKEFNKLDEKKWMTPLTGEALVMGKVMKETFISMLKREMDIAPFHFIRAEEQKPGKYRVNSNLNINVFMIIDRIDNCNGTLRFVDYKTGTDDLKVPSVDKLFDPEYSGKVKGIMQLLFYCVMYREITGDDSPIQPIIYALRNIGLTGINPLKINKKDLMDYHEVLDEFEPLLRKVIEEIFNPEVPFHQATGNDACTFCEFKSMCQREAPKY